MKHTLSQTYSEVLDQYKESLFARGLSPVTIQTNLRCISFFVRSTCSPSLDVQAKFSELTPQQILGFIDRQHLKEVSKQGNFMRVFGFFKWLEQENFILVNPFIKDIPMRKKNKMLPSKIASVDEIIQLLEASRGESFLKTRDYTALCTMYSASLRRSEVVRLTVRDFNQGQRSLNVSPSKNGEGRLVPLGKGPSERIMAYLKILPRLIFPVPVEDETPLFPTRKGSPLKPDHLSRITQKLREELDLQTPITSHSLRKSSATHMLRAGAPLEVVQKVLGHKHISSTEVYTMVNADDLRGMIEKYHPRELGVEFPLLEVHRIMKGTASFSR